MSVLADAIEGLESWVNHELEVQDGGAPAWRGRLDSAITRGDDALGGEIARLRFNGGQRELQLVARDTRAIAFYAPRRLGDLPRHLRVLRDDGVLTIALASAPLAAKAGTWTRPGDDVVSVAARKVAEAERVADVRARVVAASNALWAGPVTVNDSLTLDRPPRPENYPRASQPTQQIDTAALAHVEVTAEECRLLFMAAGSRRCQVIVKLAYVEVVDSLPHEFIVRDIRERDEKVLRIALPSAVRETLTEGDGAAGVVETIGAA